MKLLLRSLFGIYALLIFVVTLLIASVAYSVIFLFFPKGRAPHLAHRLISRNWAAVLHTIFFIPVTVKNRDYIDEEKKYVFVANHQSQLDIPLYALACRNTFRFLAKAELTKIPLMGFIIKNLYIAVDRSDRSDRHRSLEVMKASLDEGISVFLCPEGTRNRHKDPPLLPFKDGAFRLAIATQTPIAVLTVLNTGDKLSPLHPIALSPGRLYAIWDQPIETSGMTMEDLPLLKEKVRSMMEAHLSGFRK